MPTASSREQARLEAPAALASWCTKLQWVWETLKEGLYYKTCYKTKAITFAEIIILKHFGESIDCQITSKSRVKIIVYHLGFVLVWFFVSERPNSEDINKTIAKVVSSDSISQTRCDLYPLLSLTMQRTFRREFRPELQVLGLMDTCVNYSLSLFLYLSIYICTSLS